MSIVVPKELIATHPALVRGESRLMVVHRDSGKIEHRSFAELGVFFSPGDLLIANDSRVLACRVELVALEPAAKKNIDGLFLPVFPAATASAMFWSLMAKGVQPGAVLRFQDIVVRSGERNADGTLQVEFFNAHQQKLSTEKVRESFERYGKMPLPPYILKQRQEKKSTKEWPEDRQRYQNIFADPQNLGSVAAPTAGLHFTEEILQQLQQKQIRFEKLTLHVGRATFQPIQVKDYRQHRMGQEWFSIPQNLWQEVCQQRTRVFAVGTTTVRALESAKQLQQPSGVSELFIYPGYQISTINGLLTNFHLPDSTLILLVMAFVGEELTRKAYAEAVAQKYRFFSYGDAMLIL